MIPNQLTFKSEKLVVDFISLNIEGSIDPKPIVDYLFQSTFGFNAIIRKDGKFKNRISSYRNKYKVSFIQCTYNPEINSYWVGTKINFGGKNALHFYNLIKAQKVDWRIFQFDQHTLSLSRFDFYYLRIHDSTNTTESLDAFLLEARRRILRYTTTLYTVLATSPNSMILKVNRRANNIYFRIYQKRHAVSFEFEVKHEQSRSQQDSLFNNRLDIFEHRLILKYFKHSQRLFPLDDSYTDWLLDFKRRYKENQITYPSLLTSYLENKIEFDTSKEEEERFFHLLQFLSFVKSLNLNLPTDCKKHWIKKQLYYILQFPLSQFVKFTGIKITNQNQRKKLLEYFKLLQTIDPIVQEFSDGSFRSYVSFPYIDSQNPSRRSWILEVFVAEELFYFSYPFQLTKSFLTHKSKNDLRLKVKLIQTLAVNQQQKIFDLEKFFNQLSLPNSYIIDVKQNLIQLLNELVNNQIIENEVEIIPKRGKSKSIPIKKLTTSNISGRIQYLKFTENFKNQKIRDLTFKDL